MTIEESAEEVKPLFQVERQRQITQLANDDGRVDVAALAARFDVTTETIRRDLSELQRQRLLRRVHGGAIPWDEVRHEPTLLAREDQSSAEKRRIALAALEEVPEEGSIIIDSGSTLAHFARTLTSDRQLTVVTNSVPVILASQPMDNLDVVVIGGKLRKNTLAFVDSHGVEALRNILVDTMFVSCDGASVSRGFTTPYRAETAIKRAMMAAARRVVMLFDHTKINNDQLFRFADPQEIDTIITGEEADPQVLREFEKLGPVVRTA